MMIDFRAYSSMTMHALLLTQVGESLPLGSVHQAKSNLIRFVQRPISGELTGDVAFDDVKQILEALLTTDVPLAEAVGLDPED